MGVPLEVVPLTDAYWERVVSESVSEIRAGRTPNPDMLCNSRVKFGAFYDHLAAAHGGSFDRVASGHYARVVREPGPGGSRAAGPGLAGRPLWWKGGLRLRRAGGGLGAPAAAAPALWRGRPARLPACR
jgi:hypothetical protein